MGLLEQEIKEIRQIRMDFMGGKITKEVAMSQLSFYDQTEKRVKMIIQIHALSARFGKDVLKSFNKANIIGDKIAIEAFDKEVETVKCSAKDNRYIPRRECLDHSGSNLEECEECAEFSATRKILLEA